MKKNLFFLSCILSLSTFAQNVGIGTTTPADKLTVETPNNSYGITHRSTTGNILSTRIGGTTAGIGTFSATDMRIFSGGISRIFISQATGEVSIGTDDLTNGNKLFVRTAPGNYGITHSDGTITLSTFTGGTNPLLISALSPIIRLAFLPITVRRRPYCCPMAISELAPILLQSNWK